MILNTALLFCSDSSSSYTERERERGLKVSEDIAPTQVGNFKIPLLRYFLGKYLKILSWKILDQRLAPIFCHDIVHFFVDNIAAN